MALRIETFSNLSGGNALYKALCHPLAAERGRALLARLAEQGPVALYDPLGYAESVNALYGLAALDLAGVFVQKVEEVGRRRLGHTAQPVTSLPSAGARTVFLVAFDAARLGAQIAHLVPPGAALVTLDEMRLADDMLSVSGRYLDPLNFATNFAFFRDAEGAHTVLRTANYWFGHGAAETALYFRLFDHAGTALAEWRETLPRGPAGIEIDSREVRRRFGLPEFTGSLFVHAVGAAGHDVVKYALDTFADAPGVLSCTHDANAWPADLYAGLPAPAEGERVILWVQNSHPVAIPPGDIGLSLMGADDVRRLEVEIPAYATYPLDVATLVPEARWPAQLEVHAGRHFVRPRYEVFRARGPSRIAHANVERVDLVPDPRLPELGNLLGKGFILPAPVLPPERWTTLALPTPMSTAQAELPLALAVYDSSGREVVRRRLGRLPRGHRAPIDIGRLLAEEAAELEGGFGHLELMYDFSEGGEADGWLHALFRYEQRGSGHVAETSFGAHVYNLPLTYRNEPQSYIGRPPGLSTRLFLRLGPPPLETVTHLIYPASGDWHARSETVLVLHDGAGAEVARAEVRIPRSGSRFLRIAEVFDAAALGRAGGRAYVIVRDTTCRLFGYHGLLADGAFSFDHMFGF